MSPLSSLVLAAALLGVPPAQEAPPAPPEQAQDPVEQEEEPPPTEESGQEGSAQEDPPDPSPEVPSQDDEAPPEEPAPVAEQAAPPGDTPPAPAEAAPAPATPPRSDAALGIDLALRDLAAQHPTLARVEVLGHGRGGHPIPLLVLTEGADGEPRSRPALLLADESGVAPLGAQRLVALAWRLVERAEADPRVRALLERCTLIVAPLTDPDALAGDGGGVRFARNFPLGWRPATLLSGAGLQPLSEPGTLAFARLLLERGEIGLVVGTGTAIERGAPFPGSELPSGDARFLAHLATGLETRLVPWSERGSPGGGLLDQAYQAYGIPAVALALDDDADAAVDALLELAARLPRLAFVQAAPVRIGPDLWQIDLELTNAGGGPTLTELGRARGVRAEVVAAVRGGKLVASATGARPAPGAPPVFEETAFHAGREDARVPLGTLEGGARLHLRLVVAAESETVLQVTAGAPRAGTTTIEVGLDS